MAKVDEKAKEEALEAREDQKAKEEALEALRNVVANELSEHRAVLAEVVTAVEGAFAAIVARRHLDAAQSKLAEVDGALSNAATVTDGAVAAADRAIGELMAEAFKAVSELPPPVLKSAHEAVVALFWWIDVERNSDEFEMYDLVGATFDEVGKAIKAGLKG